MSDLKANRTLFKGCLKASSNIGGGAVRSVNGMAGDVVLTAGDLDAYTKEEIDSKKIVSPSAKVVKEDDISTITITDKDGTTTAEVMDGVDGTDGIGIDTIEFNPDYTMTIVLDDGETYTSESLQGEKGEPGTSPEAYVTQTSEGAEITITDDHGTTTARLTNGPQGPKGEPGTSPSATVTQTSTGARITVTDASGTTTANISNGATGPAGPKGDPGDDYVLTAADKAEIEGIIEASVKEYVDDEILGGAS